jgi:hypothetical protein
MARVKKAKEITKAEITELLEHCKAARRLMRKFNAAFSDAEMEANAEPAKFKRLEATNERIYAALRPEFSV